jgi:hypothetical protein
MVTVVSMSSNRILLLPEHPFRHKHLSPHNLPRRTKHYNALRLPSLETDARLRYTRCVGGADCDDAIVVALAGEGGGWGGRRDEVVNDRSLRPHSEVEGAESCSGNGGMKVSRAQGANEEVRIRFFHSSSRRRFVAFLWDVADESDFGAGEGEREVVLLRGGGADEFEKGGEGGVVGEGRCREGEEVGGERVRGEREESAKGEEDVGKAGSEDRDSDLLTWIWVREWTEKKEGRGRERTSLPSSSLTVSSARPVTSPASIPSPVSSGISTSIPASSFPGTPAISTPSPGFGSHGRSENGSIGTFARRTAPFEAERIERGKSRGEPKAG